MKCETLRIIGKYDTHNGATVVDIVVPAYTRTANSFGMEVGKALDLYVTASEENGTGLSLADFALRLLSIAAGEPREQEREG